MGVWQRVQDGTCEQIAIYRRFCSVGNCTYSEDDPRGYVHPDGALKTVSIEEPTCLDDGEKIMECAKCHKQVTEILKSSGEHNMQLVPDKDAPRTHYSACSVCGIKDTETGNKPCHYIMTNVTPLPKTCTETVTKEYTCESCKDTYTEEGQCFAYHSTDHSGGIAESKKPTCIEPGYVSFYCGKDLFEGAKCIYVYDYEKIEINQDAHDEEWNQVSGEEKHQCKCTLCKEILTTEDCIPNAEKTKHYPTCIADGYEIYHCQKCNGPIGAADYTTNMGKALGHDFGEGNTCLRPGCSAQRPPEVESSTYEVSDIYLENVTVNTSVQEAKSQIITDADEVNIYKSDDTIAGEDDTIATGMKLVATLGDGVCSLSIVVKGDTTGDGNADFADMVLSNKARLGKTTLENEFFKAADVNNDGENDILDLVKINKFRLSKIVEL